MKGDFSRWNFDRKKDYDGVLHQQGRVLLDSDWNDQAMIVNKWQDYASNDIIGSNRTVAVPEADLDDTFRVIGARVDGKKTRIEIMPGRAWVDGMHVCLGDAVIPAKERQPLTFDATYLEKPDLDKKEADAGSAGKGVRDVIVLTVWRDTVSGFQDTDTLMEPALGGADTTERVRTAAGLRLIRMAKNPSAGAISYDSVRKRLDETLKSLQAAKGTLTVTLNEDVDATPGTGEAGSGSKECPVRAKGGYSGLEHYLYRIEIADVDDGKPPMFKWSRLNGGLVGHGKLTGKVLTITGNRQAILSSGLSDCYVEFVALNGSSGQYDVIYGSRASLDAVDETITLDKPIFGDADAFKPYGTDDLFFRVWDGIGKIGDYKTPKVLENGIFLKFAKTLFLPGDYWTFRARVGDSQTPVIDGEPPQGIEYHYAPLALIEWNADWSADDEKASYRVPFVPLARVFDHITTPACQRITVGNEKIPGNKKSLQDAIDEAGNTKKYPGGVEIVLQPGLHRANVEINDKSNITIRGCGKNATVITSLIEKPVLAITGSSNIAISGLTIVPKNSNATGNAIEIGAGTSGKTHDVEVRGNRIIAGGIGIIINNAESVHVRDNDVYTLDQIADSGAIGASGKDLVIEDNYIAVIDPGLYNTYAGKWCDLDHEVRKASGSGLVKAYKSAGGIGANGSCSRVCIRNNYIDGGAKHGIILKNGPSDIVIEDNDITHTNDSGIWASQCTRLAVRKNRVRRCANRPATQASVVTLSNCRYVDVCDNVIEENGVDHIAPIYGVRMSECHFINILRNRIFNNGPFDTANMTGTSDSLRMGMYINTVNVPAATPDSPWFNIRENLIVQPAGCALYFNAFGNISIQDNYFNSKSPGSNYYCVYIYGFTNFKYGSMGYTIDLESNLVFSHNHIQLELIEPITSSQGDIVVSSVWIPNSNDICFCNNISDYILYNAAMGVTTFTNVKLYGNTIRASDNRLRERIGNRSTLGQFVSHITSLSTEAVIMNITKGNEADNKYDIKKPAAVVYITEDGYRNVNVNQITP